MYTPEVTSFRDGKWGITVTRNQDGRSELELEVDLPNGYHAEIRCIERTHRRRTDVSYRVVCQNGAVFHPEHTHHYHSSDPAVTALSYAARYVREIEREIADDVEGFLMARYGIPKAA